MQVIAQGPYGVKADIWALGCILYEMLALCSVSWDEKGKVEWKKIPSGLYSKHTVEVCRACLREDPVSRPTAGELLELLAVPNATSLVSARPVGDSLPDFPRICEFCVRSWCAQFRCCLKLCGGNASSQVHLKHFRRRTLAVMEEKLGGPIPAVVNKVKVIHTVGRKCS